MPISTPMANLANADESNLTMLRTLALILICISTQAYASPRWVWEDKFSRHEKQQLTDWILRAEHGMITLFGPLPYSYRVHFHRISDGHEPVPWAHTDKRNGRTVHFHVNTSYSWRSFNKDWTAPHELSHLMFPYLGRENMWFSEGIASYLQYQIMYANDTVTWKQATNKLQERFSRAGQFKSYDDMSIIKLTRIVFETGAFVRLYWGGAAYFLNVDRKLHDQKQLRLNDVITKYINCCVFQRRHSAQAMMEKFDALSDSTIFTDTHTETVMQNGFPSTDDALNWLRRHPPTLK